MARKKKEKIDEFKPLPELYPEKEGEFETVIAVDPAISKEFPRYNWLKFPVNALEYRTGTKLFIDERKEAEFDAMLANDYKIHSINYAGGDVFILFEHD